MGGGHDQNRPGPAQRPEPDPDVVAAPAETDPVEGRAAADAAVLAGVPYLVRVDPDTGDLPAVG